MFPEFVVEEIIKQVIKGQVQKAIVGMRLKKDHIGLMQSLAKWHCHLMAKWQKFDQ